MSQFSKSANEMHKNHHVFGEWTAYKAYESANYKLHVNMIKKMNCFLLFSVNEL